MLLPSTSSPMDVQKNGLQTREEILEELGLAQIPSQEVLLQEIEREILYPKDIIPEHWLSQYKLYVSLKIVVS